MSTGGLGGIQGDPGAVDAAADAFLHASKTFATAGEDVGRRGRAATAQWTGSASEAAGATIAALSTRVGEGSGVCSQVAAVLRTYAAALRAAQAAHAQARGEAGAGGELAAEAHRAQQATGRLAADDPGRENAVTTAAAALAGAQQQVAAGTDAMADAAAAARRANEAAAAAIEPLLDVVADMAPAMAPGTTSWHDAAPSPAEVAAGQGATNDTSPWELLRQHKVIREDQRYVRDELASGHYAAGDEITNVPDYSLGGLAAVPQYLGDYSTVVDGGLTGNLAVTYLGSYAVTARVVEVRGSREAVVEHHVTNTSSFASSVHVPGHGDIPGHSRGPFTWEFGDVLHERRDSNGHPVVGILDHPPSSGMLGGLDTAYRIDRRGPVSFWALGDPDDDESYSLRKVA